MKRDILKKLKGASDLSQRKIILKEVIAGYTSEGLFDDVKKYASEALSLFSREEFQTEDYLHFLNSLAYAYFHLGDYETAIPLFNQLEHLGESMNEPHFIVQSNRYIGTIFGYMKNYKDAEERLRHAQSLAMAHHLHNDLASVYNSLFMIYRAQKLFDESYTALMEGIAIAHDMQDDKLVSIFYSNIGLHYKLLEDYTQSLLYYKKSLSIKRKLKNNHGISVTLYNIGDIYNKLNNRVKASYYYSRACFYGEKSKNINILHSIYERASEFYARHGEYEEAVKYFVKRITTTEKIYDLERTKLVLDIESKYQLEKKEKESEIYRLKNIELAGAYEKIEYQNAELQKLIHSKDAILRIVSHDLKNSIGTIKNVIDVIGAHTITDASLSTFFSIIAQASEQSISLVDDILHESRIGMDDFALSLEKTSLQSFFSEYSDIFFFNTRKKDIQVITEYPEKEIFVKIDIERFYQIISNLISNATKFTHRGGEIRLLIHDEGDKVRIILKDNGVGIDPKDIVHVFEKFSSARKKGTEHEPTTGLGLSIVKRLVKLHNAEIEIESQPGSGTQISIILPQV